MRIFNWIPLFKTDEDLQRHYSLLKKNNDSEGENDMDKDAKSTAQAHLENIQEHCMGELMSRGYQPTIDETPDNPPQSGSTIGTTADYVHYVPQPSQSITSWTRTTTSAPQTVRIKFILSDTQGGEPVHIIVNETIETQEDARERCIEINRHGYFYKQTAHRTVYIPPKNIILLEILTTGLVVSMQY